MYSNKEGYSKEEDSIIQDIDVNNMICDSDNSFFEEVYQGAN